MYETSQELYDLMHAVIDDNEDLKHLDTQYVDIFCQYCNQEKKSRGRRVYADTTLVQKKFSKITKTNFVITFYKPNCERLDEEHMYRLMYHELLHVGFDDPQYSIVPHNLEDFRQCVDRWGVNWIED